MTWSPRRVLLAALCALTLAVTGTTTAAADTADPSGPAPAGYDVADDLAHLRDGYGRIIAPGGQLRNPAYLPALVKESSVVSTAQLLQQAATPDRLALTPAMVVPGWNVGNPLRAGWAGTRGRMQQVSFPNRFGALLRGTLYAPLPGARDPYTGRPVRAPYPGVIITPGSVGGSQGMYQWLAEDLAERGYLVLLFDVQGEGTSETLPHTGDPAFPFCNPFAPPQGDPEHGTQQLTPCPGVPFQQLANFTTGTVDAMDFFLSPANPWLRLWDSSPIRNPVTPGHSTRLAIVGHSMGAAAVSYVQGYDDRVATVVALDKLQYAGNGVTGTAPTDPTVPALALQAEYGFTVTPSFLSGGSSLTPAPSPDGPDPMRERATGFDAWRDHGLDTMLVVPHASTHLDFTDIPLVLPASRWGQALSSVYTQAWLGRYLRGDTPASALLAPAFRYLEPVGHGRWAPVTLTRDALLSTRYCSGYRLHTAAGLRESGDITGVGC